MGSLKLNIYGRTEMMKLFKLVFGIFICTTLVSSLPLTSVQAASVSNIVIEADEEKNSISTTTSVEETDIPDKGVGLSESVASNTEKNNTLKSNAPTNEVTEKSVSKTEQQEEKVNLQATSQTYNDWFPDDQLAREVAEALGDVSTDTVDESTLAQLTTLNVSYVGIQDMTGVEYLTGLTVLDCSGNKLTSVDITQNVQLEKVNCDNMSLLNLDVTKNPNLVELTCVGNELTNLDISHNPKLEQLTCNYNNLTNLDVTQNTQLAVLFCNGNQLTSMDISQNNQLKALWIGENQLTSIDVTHNSQLHSFLCYANGLTSIDVSQNPQLESFNCSDNQLNNIDVSQNLQLRYLRCSNNSMTNIDVSNNRALTNLYFYDNFLTSIDLSQNQQLTDLRCNNNQLTNLDLSQNQQLIELRCNNNQLTNLDLSQNQQLNRLNCANNLLKDISSITNGIPNSNYDAKDQHIIELEHVSLNGTIVYDVPADLLDKDGNLVTAITPQNGGVYDAQARTITWTNVSDDTLTYTFESTDQLFAGTVTVPVRSSLPAPIITADKEMTYSIDSSVTEATFLMDIHASTSDGSVITSDVATAVNWNQVGDYQVTLQATNTDGVAATPVIVTVHIVEPIVPTITADKEITYTKGRTASEANFLRDIHASASDGSSITSDLTTIVDWSTVGDYVVTLSIAGSNITKEVTVHVIADTIILPDNPVAPPTGDTTGGSAAGGKGTSIIHGMLFIHPVDKSIFTEAPTAVSSLPATGDSFSSTSAVLGISLVLGGILLLRKRKRA